MSAYISCFGIFKCKTDESVVKCTKVSLNKTAKTGMAAQEQLVFWCDQPPIKIQLTMLSLYNFTVQRLGDRTDPAIKILVNIFQTWLSPNSHMLLLELRLKARWNAIKTFDCVIK